MRKWLILLVLLLVGVGAWYFWSLGSLPAAAASKTTLTVDSEPVEIKHAADSAWTQAKTGDELKAGDAVRTGGRGSAAINFYDLGRSELAPASEVTISGLQPGDGQSATFAVHLDLVAGRLWSRILHFFELDDAYTVAANSVVATVRGTAFDLWKQGNGTQVAVTDSAVEVSGPEQIDAPFVVSEGFRLNFDASGKVQGTERLSDDALQSDWFTLNVRRDAAFVRQSNDGLEARLRRMNGALPGTWLDGLCRLSEKLHLMLQRDRTSELYAGYAERRLYAIRQLVVSGKSGAAMSALTALGNELNARLGAADDATLRKLLKKSYSEISTLFLDIGPASPLYRMKQLLEDESVILAGSDKLEVVYTRLKSIDARLDEASALIAQNSLDEAKTALDAARQGLTNAERDIDQLADSAPRDRLSALRGKLNMLKAREAAYRVRLATALQPPESSLNAATTTELLGGTASATPATATSTPASQYTNILLSAMPGNPQVGDKVQLKVMALDEAGKQSDVTDRSTFSLQGPARLSGSMLVPSASGTVDVTADFEDQSDRFEAQLQLVVRAAPVTLQSLQLTTASPDNLTFGSTAALKAAAAYSDGSTKDVTSAATFSSSNLTLGYMTGSVFNAGRTATGTARVVGVYAEAGKSVTAYHDFNIIGR